MEGITEAERMKEQVEVLKIMRDTAIYNTGAYFDPRKRYPAEPRLYNKYEGDGKPITADYVQAHMKEMVPLLGKALMLDERQIITALRRLQTLINDGTPGVRTMTTEKLYHLDNALREIIKDPYGGAMTMTLLLTDQNK